MFMPARQQRRPLGASLASRSGAFNGRGRPMKLVSELKPSRKARTQQAELIHRQLTAEATTAKADRLSTLESLPVEILEQIFFHCLELSLPRASPYLGRVLARPPIFSALVLFAYYEAESVLSYVETHHFLPAAYRRIISDERLRLQEGILRCRWFTLESLETCLPALSRLQMVECWYRERRGLDAMIEQQSSRRALSPFLKPDTLLPALDDKLRMVRYFNARMEPSDSAELSVGPTNRDGYLPFILTTTSWFKMGDPDNKNGRTVLAVRVLPDHILQGAPWTDAKIKLLQFLRQGLRYEVHNRNLVISPEALFDGMASAIVEENEKALLVLLELHATVVKRPAPIRRENGQVFIPDANVLPLRLFHLACRGLTSSTTGGSSRIMSLLLRGGVVIIPSDDEVLTRWAMHVTTESTSEQEVSMARWLLSYMEKQGRYRAWRAPIDHYAYPSPEGTSFTTEIGYLCVGSPFPVLWSINPNPTDVPEDGG